MVEEKEDAEEETDEEWCGTDERGRLLLLLGDLMHS